MSKVPSLKDLDPSQRILVSRTINPQRVLAEYNYLSQLIDRHEAESPLLLWVKQKNSSFEGRLVVRHDYSEVEGTALQVAGKKQISSVAWVKAAITYMKRGNQIGRLARYENVDSRNYSAWSSHTFVVASGPEQGKIVKHFVNSSRSKLPPVDQDLIAISAKSLLSYFSSSLQAANTISKRIIAEAKRQKIGKDALNFIAHIEGKQYLCHRVRASTFSLWGFPRADFEASYRNTLAEDLKLTIPLKEDKVAVSINGLQSYFSSSLQAARILNERINAEAKRQKIGEYSLGFTAIIDGKNFTCHRGVIRHPMGAN